MVGAGALFNGSGKNPYTPNSVIRTISQGWKWKYSVRIRETQLELEFKKIIPSYGWSCPKLFSFRNLYISFFYFDWDLLLTLRILILFFYCRSRSAFQWLWQKSTCWFISTPFLFKKKVAYSWAWSFFIFIYAFSFCLIEL